MSRLSRLSPTTACLFICDVQQRFRSIVWRSESVIRKCSLLLKGAGILRMPIYISEQYPKAFGKTVDELSGDYIGELCPYVYEKKNFSMLTDQLLTVFPGARPIEAVILCGLEAHVCILQTVLDLIEQDYAVYLVCDAVTSQRIEDRSVAIDRMRSMGVVMTTSESVLFELIRSADHPDFKAISKVIKESASQDQEEYDRSQGRPFQTSNSYQLAPDRRDHTPTTVDTASQPLTLLSTSKSPIDSNNIQPIEAARSSEDKVHCDIGGSEGENKSTQSTSSSAEMSEAKEVEDVSNASTMIPFEAVRRDSSERTSQSSAEKKLKIALPQKNAVVALLKVRKLSAKVISYSIQSDHADYELLVESSDGNLAPSLLRKRFSEFEELHHTLSDRGIERGYSILTLPKKQGVFGKRWDDESLLQERRDQLSEWISDVVGKIYYGIDQLGQEAIVGFVVPQASEPDTVISISLSEKK